MSLEAVRVPAAGRVLTALVVAAVVVVLGVNLLPGGKLQRTLRLRVTPLLSGHEAEPLATLDALFTDRCPTGNVYLKLRGFKATDLPDDGFVLRRYFRGSYAVLPRRVYVSTGQCRITNAREILAANDEPAPAWLHAHGVRYVVTFDRNALSFPEPQVEEVRP